MAFSTKSKTCAVRPQKWEEIQLYLINAWEPSQVEDTKYQNPRAVKVGQSVYLYGAVENNVSKNWDWHDICILPEGWRPRHDTKFNQYAYRIRKGTQIVTVHVDGRINLQFNGQMSRLLLDGIHFIVEQGTDQPINEMLTMFSSIKQQNQEMAAMQREIMILKEKVDVLQEAVKGHENKEETEEEKFRKWLQDEVKLPQYFGMLKQNGFDDMDSLQDLVEEDLSEMGIEKVGHRRRLMRNVDKWKEIVSNSKESHKKSIPLVAHGIAAEGANIADTQNNSIIESLF